MAEAELSGRKLAKVEIERQVLKAEETLRYYQERLADTKIASPFDGLVVRRSREPGDIVVPGSEILQVISTDQMWVSAWVDETAMASLAVGQPARVVFRSEPEQTFERHGDAHWRRWRIGRRASFWSMSRSRTCPNLGGRPAGGGLHPDGQEGRGPARAAAGHRLAKGTAGACS